MDQDQIALLAWSIHFSQLSLARKKEGRKGSSRLRRLEKKFPSNKSGQIQIDLIVQQNILLGYISHLIVPNNKQIVISGSREERFFFSEPAFVIRI